MDEFGDGRPVAAEDVEHRTGEHRTEQRTDERQEPSSTRCGRQAAYSRPTASAAVDAPTCRAMWVGVPSSSPNTKGVMLCQTSNTPHHASAGRIQPPRPRRAGCDLVITVSTNPGSNEAERTRVARVNEVTWSWYAEHAAQPST